jgi:hypothetical protein
MFVDPREATCNCKRKEIMSVKQIQITVVYVALSLDSCNCCIAVKYMIILIEIWPSVFRYSQIEISSVSSL